MNTTTATSTLWSRFDQLELSYDGRQHRKVPSPPSGICLAIPWAPKCLLWFTFDGEEDVCLMFTYDHTHLPVRQPVRIRVTSADHRLHYGTVLYGSKIAHGPSLTMVVEDVWYFRGIRLTPQQTFLERCACFKQVVDACQFHSGMRCVLPYFWPCEGLAWQDGVHRAPYRTHHIEFRGTQPPSQKRVLGQRPTAGPYTSPTPRSPPAPAQDMVFDVRATLSPDIYHVFQRNTNVFHSVACIPDYATSVRMNTLFRHVKENHSLDALEMSDDEDEFADDREDRFVDLDKCIPMVCKTHPRFRSLVPVRPI